MSELAIQQQPTSASQAQRGAMQAITPGQMISIALEKGADFAQLEKLMDMQERWERNEARKAFVKAKAGFKADCPPVTKNRHVRFENRTGGFTDYRHATLDHILDTVCPVMSEYGLSHSWKTEQKDGLIYVTCRLEHELGHVEETTLFGPPDTSGGKNQVQAIGSTTSFLERYTFTAITGIATGDLDDDGAGGAGAAPKQSAQPKHSGEKNGQLPPYAEDKFKANLPKWRNLITSGQKTAEHVINTLSSRATLTQQQVQQIKGESQ